MRDYNVWKKLKNWPKFTKSVIYVKNNAKSNLVASARISEQKWQTVWVPAVLFFNQLFFCANDRLPFECHWRSKVYCYGPTWTSKNVWNLLRSRSQRMPVVFKYIGYENFFVSWFKQNFLVSLEKFFFFRLIFSDSFPCFCMVVSLFYIWTLTIC